jgi:hypothetical protein
MGSQPAAHIQPVVVNPASQATQRPGTDVPARETIAP